MMQWRVTRSFRFPPSLCSHHTCTPSHFLLEQHIKHIKANSNEISVLLLGFWWRSGVRSTGVPFDISNLFGLFLPPPPHTPPSSPSEVAQGCLAVVGKEPVAGWKSVCLWLLLIADAVWYLGWSLICLVAEVLQLLWYLERRLGLGSCQCLLLPLSLSLSLSLSSYRFPSLSLNLSHPFESFRSKQGWQESDSTIIANVQLLLFS